MKRKPKEEKKIYTSFHEIPPREYMYFPKATLEISKPGKFSKVEIKHLLISMLVLTFAFAIAYSDSNVISVLTYGFSINRLAYGFVFSLLGIFTAFFFHEIAHKFVAQKYGLWAEYRMFPQGLAIALLLAIFTPFVFAAPGAVMFRGGARDFETGRIAMAGPLANIIISLLTLPILLFIFFEDPLLSQILGFICLINAFLATFNLLPIGPLDGTKIIRWNATVWIIALALSITLLICISSKVIMF